MEVAENIGTVDELRAREGRALAGASTETWASWERGCPARSGPEGPGEKRP